MPCSEKRLRFENKLIEVDNDINGIRFHADATVSTCPGNETRSLRGSNSHSSRNVTNTSKKKKRRVRFSGHVDMKL